MADEKKPIPLSAGDRTTSIPLGGNTIARMFGSAVQPNPDAESKLRSALSMSGHGGDSAYVPARVAPQQTEKAVRPQQQASSIYARGDSAYDIVHEKKVTIIKAGVAFSPRGTPFHKVTDKNGRTWVQSEKKLQSKTQR